MAPVPLVDYVTPALAVLGGLYATNQVFNLASFIQVHFLHRSKLASYKKASNEKSGRAWALVTGATDGIGRGFAEELCDQGFNVVIHGRNAQKLEKLKESLITRWPQIAVQTLRIDADKEASDPSAFERAASELQSLDLRVLINNIGGGGGLASFVTLQNRTHSQVGTFIDVNTRFPTEITRALLPQLRQNGPALIINIGSVTSELGIPYLSVYSGCKSYNKSWSKSLGAEMKADGTGVEVFCLLVAAVATDNVPRPLSLFVPSTRQLAKSALRKVGCGGSVVFAYWPHQVQATMFQIVPEWVTEKLVTDVGKQEKREEEERLAKT